MTGVVHVVGALKVLESRELHVAGARVALIEPRGPVADAEVEPLHKPALDEASRHWGMEPMVIVWHQHAGDRGATIELLRELRVPQEAFHIDAPRLDRQQGLHGDG